MVIPLAEGTVSFIKIDGVVRGDEGVAYRRILHYIGTHPGNVFDDHGNICAGDEQLQQISDFINRVSNYQRVLDEKRATFWDRRALERKRIILESLKKEIMESRRQLIKFLRQCFENAPLDLFRASDLSATFENVSILLDSPDHQVEAVRFTGQLVPGIDARHDMVLPYLSNPQLDDLVLKILSQVFNTEEGLTAFARGCIDNHYVQAAGRLFIYFADQPAMVYGALQRLQNESVITFPLACRLIEASGANEAEVERALALVTKLEKIHEASGALEEEMAAEEEKARALGDEVESFVKSLSKQALRDYVFPPEMPSTFNNPRRLYFEECILNQSQGACLRQMGYKIYKAEDPYEINWQYEPPAPYVPRSRRR